MVISDVLFTNTVDEYHFHGIAGLLSIDYFCKVNDLDRDINSETTTSFVCTCPLMDLPGMEGKKKKCCKSYKKSKRCKSCPKR
jgi:hypothetical protein